MDTRLAELPRVLTKRTGQPAPAGAYGRLWRGIVDGRLPAERAGRGWMIREADLDAAARLLGMSASNQAERAAA